MFVILEVHKAGERFQSAKPKPQIIESQKVKDFYGLRKAQDKSSCGLKVNPYAFVAKKNGPIIYLHFSQFNIDFSFLAMQFCISEK